MSLHFVIASTLLQAAGYGAIGWKLIATGLAGTYRCFTAFVLLECIRVLISGVIPRHSNAYGNFYFATQPLPWLLHALMTLEVYHLVFRSQPAIASLSRRVIAFAVATAVLFSAATLGVRSDVPSLYRILEAYLTLERAINFSLFFFVLLLMGFLAWYPVPLTRNALVHTSVFSFYFGVKSVGLLIRTLLGPETAETVNFVVLGTSLASILVWLTCLTPEGERAQVRTGYRRRTVDHEKLISQMEAINRTLLRSAKD